jgi:predicted metal-dependent phosphoesterase TrpH
MTEPLRIDLHVHTCWSPDARIAPAVLVERAAELGLDRVAVTDHGEVEGALRAQALDWRRVIVGEEIRCRGRTEIIGLFLTERIPAGLRLEEAAERIRDQGGLVYAPHPWAYLVTPGRHARRAVEAADVVEVFNSRAFLEMWNRKAASTARSRGLAGAASSDAHFVHELGRAWTEVPEFEGPDGLLEALRRGRPVARATGSPAVHVVSVAWRTGRAAGHLLPSRAGAPDRVPLRGLPCEAGQYVPPSSETRRRL